MTAAKPFPAYEGDDPYFFVSYAHGDAELVYSEMGWLEPAGFNLWYDDGIHVGSVWRSALADALSGASGVIYFATATSIESTNCLQELNFALDEEKPVIVVQLDDTRLPGLLRLSLSDRQALVRSVHDEATYQSRFIAALSSIVPPIVRAAGAEAPNSSVQNLKADPPSVAVMPFACLSDEKALSYMAQGISGDLIARLSGRVWHIIAGRNEDASLAPSEIGQRLGVRYLLSGSIQRGGDRIRVTSHFTDTATGNQISAQRYERSGEDLLDIQDQIAASIDFDVFKSIMPSELHRLRDLPDHELDAWGLCARSEIEIVDRATRDRVVGLLELAIQRDPNFAYAHSLLAWKITFIVFHQLTRDVEQSRERALAATDTALSLAPTNCHPEQCISCAPRVG